MKIKTIIKSTLLLGLIATFAIGCKDDDEPTPTPQPEVKMAVLAEGNSVIQGKKLTHPITNEVLETYSFLMDLKNPETGEVIGTLRDCIVNDVFNPDGTITSRVISILNIYERGSIMLENQVLQVPTATEGIYTTIAHPKDNNIIDATGEFEGITGKVTLDGEIDLTQFEEANVVHFHCLFTIDAK